jgi:hypothetical protein
VVNRCNQSFFRFQLGEVIRCPSTCASAHNAAVSFSPKALEVRAESMMLLTACGWAQPVCDQVANNVQTDATVALAALTGSYVLLTKGLADSAAHQVEEMKRALGMQYRPYVVVTPEGGLNPGVRLTNNSRADAYFCVVCSTRASPEGQLLLVVGPVHLGAGDSHVYDWQAQPDPCPDSSILGPKPQIRPVVFFRNALEQTFRCIHGQLTEEGTTPDRNILVLSIKGETHEWVPWYRDYVERHAVF